MTSPESSSSWTQASIPLRWCLAFSLLILAVHEAHELVHVLTGRLVCGTWAARDFNAWWFTRDCPSVLPTLAGPLLSYLLMLAGAALALRSVSPRRWAGVGLLFAANPFARVFTVAMGGGDEMVVGRYLAGVAERTPAVRIAVVLVVAAICGSAMVAGWRALAGLKRRALWFTGLLVWPMVLTGTLLFLVGNRLLRAGVLTEPPIAGAPLLVIVVTVVVFALTALTARWLSIDKGFRAAVCIASILLAGSAVGALPVAGHYERGGEYESAEIDVETLENGRIKVTGEALWGKTRELGPNIGTLEFETTVENGVAVYSEDEYRVELHFGENGLHVEETNHVGRHGMNVTFAGDYTRTE